jgi:hypothetical protein
MFDEHHLDFEEIGLHYNCQRFPGDLFASGKTWLVMCQKYGRQQRTAI